MSSSLVWGVTQRRLVVTDVSGQPTGPILKDQAVQEDCLTLQDRTGCVTSQKSEELINIAGDA